MGQNQVSALQRCLYYNGNGKCKKLALLEPREMPIIEKCLYCRGVGKKRCNCTVYLWQLFWMATCNANRTEWSPIWSVIIRVVNKIGRLRQWHVLSNHWTVHAIVAVRHDAYFPIKAEIRAVDNQSDLGILL